MSALGMGSKTVGDIKEPDGRILPQPLVKEGHRIASEAPAMASREVPGRAMALGITATPMGKEEAIAAGDRQMTALARMPPGCLGIESPSAPASRFPSSSAPLPAVRATVLSPGVRGREDHTAIPNDRRERPDKTVVGRVRKAALAPIGPSRQGPSHRIAAPKGHPLPVRRPCSAQTTRRELPVRRWIVCFPALASVPAP